MLENIVGPTRPVSWVLEFWPVLAFSFIFALAATAMCKKIAIHFGIVDTPDAKVKTHKEPIAYLGGVGMLVGLTVGILAGLYMVRNNPEFGRIFQMLIGVLAGATIACAIGVLDDILDIRPWQKLLGQTAAACILLLVGIRPALDYYFNHIGTSIPPAAEYILSIPIVIFFVLGATNSLNLLDGLDGLCAGVTAIITVAMLLLATHLATWSFSETGDPVRIIITLALVGGVAGFLPFNRHPAKIFMGDAGSLLLGFCIAALMILFAEKLARWVLAAIMVFGLPILDTATAMVRRLVNKRPLFVSDRGHIYDQLIDRGYTLNQTVTICYILAGGYAFIGLLISQIRTRYGIIVAAAVIVASSAIIWKMGFLKMEGIRGATRKKNE